MARRVAEILPFRATARNPGRAQRPGFIAVARNDSKVGQSLGLLGLMRRDDVVNDSPVLATLDYDEPGKHFGLLQVPRSTNESGWSNLFVPIVCIKNGDGPTALVLGGNHGDEPEGQVAALKLARETRTEDVNRPLLIIPSLSPSSSRPFTRPWPCAPTFNRTS